MTSNATLGLKSHNILSTNYEPEHIKSSGRGGLMCTSEVITYVSHKQHFWALAQEGRQIINMTLYKHINAKFTFHT